MSRQKYLTGQQHTFMGYTKCLTYAQHRQEDCDLVPEKTPFWIVWNPSDNGCRYRYADQIAAEIEAERLAEGNPGEEIYVLEPVCVVMRKQVEIKRFVPT